MNRLVINICPLCGGCHFDHAMSCIDHYASGEKFDLLRCDKCGFMFTQSVPDENEIGRYYETPDYISHSDTSKGVMNNVYHHVRKFMLHKKSTLVKRVTGLSKGSILDIGTGTGYFSNEMKRVGWEVSAIEKSEQARDFARRHFGIEVDDDKAINSYLPATFDAITLWHVMEHLQHLDETWEILSSILKNKGSLIIAVPNPSSYDASKYKEMWAAYDVPRHLWHFTPDVIRQMGEKHGFLLKQILPMPFDAFYVSMLSEKYKKNKDSFIKGLFVGSCAWISALFDKERSSSLIYVFIKK